MGDAGRRRRAGESDQQALQRELREEIGLHDFELGPLVFDGKRSFPFERRLYLQHNRIYRSTCTSIARARPYDLEAEGVIDFRSVDHSTRSTRRASG